MSIRDPRHRNFSFVVGMYTLNIESLDQEGRGVAHQDGKTIFVDSALPGEVVQASPYRRKPSFEMAATQAVPKPSPARVTPHCIHFNKCGGCSLQHLDWRAQVAAKQRVLEESLWHIGKVKPEQVLPAIYGQAWGYRNRARLAVRHVPKKGGMLVGFHEKRSSFVADMTSCEVMPTFISKLLQPLRDLIGQLSIRDRLPQVEVAVGEDISVLVLRVLQSLTPEDETLLHEFARIHGVWLYLQPKGPESAYPFHPEQEADLHYVLREFDLKIRFGPTDFTQVNHEINRVLVRRALSLLDPHPGERVADFFCGIGTFGLACARNGAVVVGLEGSSTLVERAGRNAVANGLGNAARFQKMDLFRVDSQTVAALGRFDRILIDPPRDGAVELVKSLDGDMPERIVYMSCNPATLARDASVLVHAKNYCMRAAGVVNMFPHTSHVESIAVFDRK